MSEVLDVALRAIRAHARANDYTPPDAGDIAAVAVLFGAGLASIGIGSLA